METEDSTTAGHVSDVSEAIPGSFTPKDGVGARLLISPQFVQNEAREFGAVIFQGGMFANELAQP